MSGSPMPAAGAITWAELAHSDVLRDVRLAVMSSGDREVRSVQLVSDVEAIRTSRPGAVVVLQEPIARAPWAVEVAVRYAWERDVRCVIAQLDEAAAQSVTRLAERLSTSVGFFDGDPCDLALRLAALVTRPDAMHARLVARSATRLAEQSTLPAALNALNQELPGVRVGLYGGRGNLVAGLHVESPPESHVVRVSLGSLDFQSGRELVAVMSRNSPAWRETVTRVLKIARAHVIVFEASTRVSLAEQAQRERWALGRLMGDAAEPGLAEELGWMTHGRLVGAMLLPLDFDLAGDEDFGLALRAMSSTRRGDQSPVPYGEGWVLWESCECPNAVDDDDGSAEPAQDPCAQRLADRLHKRYERSSPAPVCVGVGAVSDGIAGLVTTLGQAELAARTVRASGSARAATFSSLGSQVLLAAGGSNLFGVAQDALADLLTSEDGEQLVSTLAAYLDCGGSTLRAAERLGVHRNTVTGRIDRVRRAGLPIDDPDRRLGLHVACYLVTAARSAVGRFPEA